MSRTSTLSEADRRAGATGANWEAVNQPGGSSGTHDVGYDKGFVIRPHDAAKYPYELRLNARIQFRHVGFARNVDSWVDNAGTVRPVLNRNFFDIERARLLARGTVIDPRMSLFLQLDGDTDGSHIVDFFDYWFAWQFGDLVEVQVGKRKVPGSRNWLLSAFDTLLADRPMATDFFRPDRTVGVWFVGSLGERMHYEAMVGNGYRTSNLPPAETNDRFAYAVTHWLDLGGEFGTSLSDFAHHNTPVLQIGHSFTFARQSGLREGRPLQESDFVRLTDGTVLDSTGALAPGVTVDHFDIYLYSADAAVKYRGLSLNTEYFFRWLVDLRGNGPLPHTDLFARGFFAQGSYYLVPETLYLAARYSQISGLFGDSHEYAAGVNWYVQQNRQLKLTFDVTALDGSPLNNTSSDILVGDDGVLFRTQFQAMF